MKAYAGIGSRRTPEPVLSIMTTLAHSLARTGWTLRSGHARGADQAFENGARERAEVYLPWPEFEAGVPIYGERFDRPGNETRAIAAAHHPHWGSLDRGARLLHARNTHIILGRNCRPDDVSAFVVCWTQDAQAVGGTGQALRLAKTYGVEVFNLANRGDLARVTGYIATDAFISAAIERGHEMG